MNDIDTGYSIAQMSFIPLLDMTRDFTGIFSGDNYFPDKYLELMIQYTALIDDIVKTDSNHASTESAALAKNVIFMLNNVVSDPSKTYGSRQLAALKSAHLGYIMNAIGCSFSTSVDPTYWPQKWIELGHNPMENNDQPILSS